MANNWDASIKLLYPADQGTSFTADTVKLNDPFDAIGDIEVGRGIHQFTVEHTLRVSVRNLSRSTTIATGTKNEKLPPDLNSEVRKPLVVSIGAGWGPQAAVGDVLELIASYEVVAGANTDTSQARSQLFMVVA